ncbi:hypothetical protein ACF8EA_23725, partial [Pseudomonas sp. YQ_5]|uniref:hypothetical protein n=1 Tax=Pseudomonas sp. YQ_5 TaxID=3367229 RepID=UPI00370AF220
HGGLAPERNREHSIGNQVDGWNVGMMDPLQCHGKRWPHLAVGGVHGSVTFEHLPYASSVADYEALLPWNCSPEMPR